MRRFLLSATAVIFLAGCGPIPEADFPEEFGSTYCKRIKECDKGAYESDYTDKEDCIDDWADFADTMLDLGDLLGGDYNEEMGRECVTAIKDATCGEIDDGDVECDLFE